MIKARHQVIPTAVFHHYLKRLLRRQFYSIKLLGEIPVIDPDLPVLLLPNHSTWWDAFLGYWINTTIFKRKPYLMALATQLQENPFFARIGAFSVDPESPRHVRQSLRYALEVLDQGDPAPLMIIFPQGELRPWNSRPISMSPGVEFLLRRSTRPIQVCHLSIRAEFTGEQLPEIFMRLFHTETITELPDGTLANWERAFDSELERLASEIHTMTPSRVLFQGKRSVNERRARVTKK